MRDIIFLDLPERGVYVPPLASLSIVSYIKEKGFSIDYINLSSEIFKYLSNKKYLERNFKKIKNLLGQHTFSLKETLAFKFLISFLKTKIINPKKGVNQIKNDINKYAWFFYSIIFDNKDPHNWYFEENFLVWRAKRYFIQNFFYCTDYSIMLRKILLNDIKFKKWFLEIIKDYNTIAFSIPYKQQFKIVLELAEMIKGVYPEKKIIVGGKSILYHFNTKSIQKEQFRVIDFFVPNEGEITLHALAISLKKNLPLIKVPNIIYFDGENIISNKQRVIRNLDTLPKPDYPSYLSKYGFPIPDLCLSKKYGYPVSNSKMVLYEQSRGCKWRKCKFCGCCSLNMKEPYREKNPKKVVKELIDISKETGCNSFWLINEEMIVDYAIRFSKEILKRKAHVRWITFIRFEEELDFKTLELMRNAGCVHLRFGLESGNQKINNLIGKNVDVKIAERILEECKQVGIPTTIFVIVGFPMESLLQALDTFNFIRRNIKNISIIHLRSFVLRPYSYMYLHPKRFGVTKIISIQENKFIAKNYFIKQKFLTVLKHLSCWYFMHKNKQVKIIIFE